MHLGFGFNQYGVRISKHKCDTCGDEFTVVPAKEVDDEGWENCLSKICESYDPARDADKFFEEDSEAVVLKKPTGRLN